MNPLDIYSEIETSLEFDKEIESLHNFYIKLIKQYAPKTLLDIGCGQGNILERLQDLDMKTLGIDLSQSQIDVCLNKNLNARCISLDKLDNTKYDMIIAVFDVLNYISKTQLKDFFNEVKKRLNKNGKFIFDINSKFGFEEVAQGSLVIDKTDSFVSIDAIFEDNILYTTINNFIKQNNLYIRQKGVIKQYYHSKSDIKRFSKMNMKEIEFYLHTFKDESECDKYIYVLE